MTRKIPSKEEMHYLRNKLRQLMAREFGGKPEDYWVFGPDDPDDPLRQLLEDKEVDGPALPF